MKVYAVLMPIPQPGIIAEIERKFGDDHTQLNDTQYLVAFNGTAIDLTAKLGIHDAKSPTHLSTGNAVIMAMSSYYGRGPTSVWDWIKTKLEAPERG